MLVEGELEGWDKGEVLSLSIVASQVLCHKGKVKRFRHRTDKIYKLHTTKIKHGVSSSFHGTLDANMMLSSSEARVDTVPNSFCT